MKPRHVASAGNIEPRFNAYSLQTFYERLKVWFSYHSRL
jgi:hypothetical protein